MLSEEKVRELLDGAEQERDQFAFDQDIHDLQVSEIEQGVIKGYIKALDLLFQKNTRHPKGQRALKPNCCQFWLLM